MWWWSLFDILLCLIKDYITFTCLVNIFQSKPGLVNRNKNDNHDQDVIKVLYSNPLPEEICRRDFLFPPPPYVSQTGHTLESSTGCLLLIFEFLFVILDFLTCVSMSWKYFLWFVHFSLFFYILDNIHLCWIKMEIRVSQILKSLF